MPPLPLNMPQPQRPLQQNLMTTATHRPVVPQPRKLGAGFNERHDGTWLRFYGELGCAPDAPRGMLENALLAVRDRLDGEKTTPTTSHARRRDV